jgi:hypothetical protein
MEAQELINSIKEEKIDWIKLKRLVELDEQLDSSKYITN